MHNHEKTRVCQRLEEAVSQLLPILFWILLIFGFEERGIAVATIIAAVIHEAGHVIYIRARKIKGGRLCGAISGLRIRSLPTLSYLDEIMIYLSGPLANLLAALAMRLLCPTKCALLSLMNVVTAASNLLPVEGYDGYGALRAMAERINPDGILVRLLRIISGVTVFAFSILSIYFIDRFGCGYWIFAVFFCSLLAQLGKWLKNVECEF